MKTFLFALSLFPLAFHAKAEDSYCQDWAVNPNNEVCTSWQNGNCQSWVAPEGYSCKSWSDGWQPWY